MQFQTRLTDPMWGAVPITALEERVLRNRRLTRLSHIRQMGLAFLDYPSLSHTRIEHCIGVMHVADTLFEMLANSGRPNIPLFHKQGLSARRQAVRLAALLHDLGHPPFSHAVESTFKRYPGLLRRARNGGRSYPRVLFEEYSHETFTRWMIEELFRDDASLGDAVKAALEGATDVEEIAALAVGQADGDLSPFNRIISGDFDADRIDYLIRDNRRSGFPIGLSPDELREAIHFDEGGVGFYIDAFALPFVNSVLAARQRLIERVHLAPAGRTATQMLINGFYCILDTYDDATLARTIIWLHRDCTDFTYYRKFLENAESTRAVVRGLDLYFIGRFERLARHPSADGVWPEFATIDFMHMHPCLRLLVHIAANADWSRPGALTFRDEDGLVFIEPSTRPSQGSDMLVDYGRTFHRPSGREPSLDFIGTTENRLGRTIFIQSMENLDVYAYRLDEGGDGVPAAAHGDPEVAGSLGVVSGDSDSAALYLRGLGHEASRVGASLVGFARERRKVWPTEMRGMRATEYLLTLLYALVRDATDHWPSASGVYVYRSEFFIHRFLASLTDQPLFPGILRDAANLVEGKRTFSQIQRLAAYGLLLTRSNSAFSETRGGPSPATRCRVYSTREEITVSGWGRYYVEMEIEPAFRDQLCEMVRNRQAKVRPDLEALARLDREVERHGPGGPMDPVQAEASRLELASRIHASAGCAVTFLRAEAEA